MLKKLSRYLTRSSIFFMTMVLIATTAACGPIQYNLTVSSTEGGAVIEPGQGTFSYDRGTLVNLVAETWEGYHFVNWTGDVSTIANVNADATTITMNGHYSITANFAPGNLEIRTWYDLDAVRDNLSCNHTLMNDLDSTTPGYEELAGPTANGGKGWQPIGTDIDPFTFTGSFDGQGYKICDLFINRPGADAVGLFGAVAPLGVIKDVAVVNATVTGNLFVGVLAGGGADSTVSNSYSTGNVTGGQCVGGLLGWNAGNVSDSYFSGSVTGDQGVGGLVGANTGNVSNSYSTGNVTGNVGVGGLAGGNGLGPYGSGTVSNSYSTCSVTGNDYVGGLVGKNDGSTVTNSYSTGSISGNSSVGGLVGLNYEGTVSNSFWDTETSGQSTSDGGTGKNTTEMKNIATFSGAAWNIIAVALNETNLAYIWNIVNNITYPFLSWQPTF